MPVSAVAPIAHVERKTVRVVIEGQPLPAARPRVTKKGTYTPKPNRIHEEAVTWEIRLALRQPHKGTVTFSEHVAVYVVFYRRDRHRVDADNLLKLVLDAATKAGAWHDDSQVTYFSVRLRVDPKRPRTELVITEDDEC